MYLFMPVCWLCCLSVFLFFGCTILAMDFEFIMFVRSYSALGSACCELCVCTACAYTGVAGELCKLARVTGPEFPHPLLSSRTLPASDWPVPRGAV